VTKKILLDESDIPERWYNILPDMPGPPAPYLNPQTLLPMGPADLAPIFPQAIIAQEVSAEPWIEIPDQVREIYKIWRPSPLYRADRLEKVLDTPAHIYFKYEGVSPAGSHKPNTAVAQAYYNAKEGVKRLTTETGAGQWGSALAFAGALFNLEVTVYMVKVSPGDDGDVGRDGVPIPHQPDQRRARHIKGRPRLAGQPRDRDLGSGRGRGHPR